MSDFTSRSVAYGLKFDELSAFDKATQKKLLRLMARISEKSYRRGFQQGKFFQAENIKTIDPVKFRFELSLDKSPFTDCFNEKGQWVDNKLLSAIDRLLCENGELRELGFYFSA